jgi:hypothetical protein
VRERKEKMRWRGMEWGRRDRGLGGGEGVLKYTRVKRGRGRQVNWAGRPNYIFAVSPFFATERGF